MNILELSKKLHPLERKVLPYLSDECTFDEIVTKSKFKDIEVMRAIQWLENKKVLDLSKCEIEIINLDKNGIMYKEKGLPEKRFLKAIEKESLSLSKLGFVLDKNEIGISLGLLRRKGAIETKKDKELVVSITNKGKEFLKEKTPEEKFLELKFPIEFSSLNKDQQSIFKELFSRKNLVKKDKKTLITVKTTKLLGELQKLKLSTNVIDTLDSKSLKSGSWKNKEFRKYDVEINVPKIHGGKRHFTSQVIEYVKSIWLELGFTEMTGNMVHTSFWNLDSLFIPQDHPAREMQDTFYLKNPKKGRISQRNLMKNIKQTHENGWTTGSLGYKYKWSEEIAKENLLRTHTTVLSALTLSNLKKEDLPAKFFAVGKNFRNEALDWKHLFEFYQVEGIVVDPDANFKNLLGYLKNFFSKMGFPDVRIRPGHFPYTEPSAEVDVWHPIKKQWVEIGGSGIFRPEVTKPLMGFDTPVLAWGLGLGRLIMDYWNINDLRQYYKNDLKQLRDMKVWLK
jgi:phenylalanyl-tRNA synthetase alpha chain